MKTRQPLPIRRGFTLVELLIAIGIVTLLAAILVVAIGRSGVKAREQATAALIKKISGQVQDRLEAFDRLRSQQQTKTKAISEFKLSPLNVSTLTDSQREILGFKMLLRQLFPQTFTDLNATEFSQEFNPSHQQYPYNASKHNENTESAELLYYALVRGKALGIPTVDPGEFKANEVADTDGDGLLEFIDAWGRPLRFYRWPTRLICPSCTFDSQGRPTNINTTLGASILISGLPASATSLGQDQDDPTLLVQPTSAAAAISFEQSFHTPQTWHHYLIVSSGPDGLKLGASDDAFGLYSPTNKNPATLGYLAQPITSNPSAFDALTDNITNRNRP